MSPEEAGRGLQHSSRRPSKIAWVLFGAVVLAAALTLAVVVALMFAVRPDPARELEEQVIFPAVWTPTDPDDDMSWRDAEVSLEADGAAQLGNVPGGRIQQSEGILCLVRSEGLFTGPAQWTARAGGYVELSYEGGSLVLVPHSGKFGSADWIDASIPFCGDEPAATFGLRSDPKLGAG